MSNLEHGIDYGSSGSAPTVHREATSNQMASGEKPRTRPNVLARLGRNGKARIGGGLLVLIILTAVAAPVLTQFSPTDQNILQKSQPPIGMEGGNWTHPLGTDHLGRDMLSRILFGARISLMIGAAATILAAGLGILLGILSGYFRGGIDSAIMRLVDVQMAFPSILLALAVMVMLGPGITNLVLVLGITSWILFSRIIRADVLSTKERDFMLAGRAVGASDSHLIQRYIFPNLVGTITILITLTLARTIISESSLSFLGLGIEPPTPSWGGMLAEGRSYLSTAWWITTFPGISLMITVVGVNLLGDALRDVLDPRLDAGDH